MSSRSAIQTDRLIHTQAKGTGNALQKSAAPERAASPLVLNVGVANAVMATKLPCGMSWKS